MGRVIGRRPDPTAAIARALRRHLRPEERVIAGVYVQRPGTTVAQAAAGARAGVAGALETGVSFGRDDDPEYDRWLEQAAAFGIQQRLAERSVFVCLALTTSRLLVVRRSRLTRRPRELLAAWPITEIEAIAVPRNGGTLSIRRAGAELPFELPQAHRFLPQVYRDLPALLRRVVEHDETAAPRP